MRARLTRDPTSIAGLRAIGQLLEARNNPAIAERWFHRAIVTAPNDVAALSSLATLLVHRHRQDHALPYLRRAIILAPDDPNASFIHLQSGYGLFNVNDHV